MKILDIGCGWGAFAKFASEKYNVDVLGITVSKEQEEFAKNICKNFVGLQNKKLKICPKIVDDMLLVSVLV